jgi:CPA1 family monovalent cation:H+ antiporter
MHKKSAHRWLDALMMTFSGVSGTISLALALTLPSQVNGHSFTYRPMLIFVASVVIIISIVLPALALPRMVPDQENEDLTEKEHQQWNRKMVTAAVHKVRSYSDVHPSETSIVVSSLEEQLVDGKLRHPKRERQILVAANEAELEAVKKLHREGGSLSQRSQPVFPAPRAQHFFFRQQIVEEYFASHPLRPPHLASLRDD